MTDFKRLGDIATYINGYAFKPEDRGNEGLPIIRIQDLTGNSYDLGFYNGEYSERIEINNGDVLISWSGSLGVYLWNKGKALLNQHIFKVVFDKAEIDKSYFIYAIQHYLKEMEAKTHGATMKHITKKDFDDMLVPYPNMQKQRETAGILSMVDGIIVSCQQELTKLDELVKSRFVEMFIGKNYSRKTVDEVSLGKGEYGAQSASAEYTPDRPRYVRITDINDDGTLNNDVVSSINHSDDDQYRLRYGDFLFARMGATVGKTYAFREGNQIYAGYLIRYKLDLTQIHPLYLFWYTRLNEYWDWVKLNQSGAAQPGINAKKFGSLRIPVPPIDIQNHFVAFVAEVDKSKFRIQKSLSTSRKLWTLARIDAIMNMDFSTQRSL